LFDYQWLAVLWLTAWAAWPGGSSLRGSDIRQQPHHAGQTSKAEDQDLKKHPTA